MKEYLKKQSRSSLKSTEKQLLNELKQEAKEAIQELGFYVETNNDKYIITNKNPLFYSDDQKTFRFSINSELNKNNAKSITHKRSRKKAKL